MRWLAAILIGLFLVIGSFDARAEPYQPPPLRGYVVDETGALTASQVESLDRELAAFRAQKGFAIVAFVVASLGERNIEDVAYDTFNTWEIGDAGKDNGALLVIAPTERRVRIETGKGVGGELTDIESAEILRTHVIPPLEEGDLHAAVAGGTRAIGEALAGDLAVQPEGPRESPGVRSPLANLGMLIGLGLLILLMIFYPPARSVVFLILSALVRGGGGGLSGGGGGGFSSGGGGGRSGGGGASQGY